MSTESAYSPPRAPAVARDEPPVPWTARVPFLLAFSAATILLIPLEMWLPGGVAATVALVLLLRDPVPAFRRRLGTLLGCVALLAASPIHTDTSTRHFATLGLPFFLAIVGPAVLLARTDPGVIRYRFFPRRIRKLDLLYTAISIPLAWLVIEFYFFHANPELPTHWPLPAVRDAESVRRLFIGINCVGIWDELFFVNTVYAVLRSVFPFRVANAVQAVVYSAVLTDMAFTGIGPVVVYAFAWTQGAMFEKAEGLLWVLVVHLIVDFYLVAAIVGYHYPGSGYAGF
ncbi:MAG: hypothetical protein QF819_06685 [Gemmatimonadota bacterium]|jgi:hypothetical protein|nr:hypothetical protein [Gemmatimonadota bacterium]MDP6529156.1 hypothetical protein [Gemmatimonadota bacterium]MDP6802845.1 hypothetical protein [Gemmatimonadota bacterium]MDP7032209.1 hypothetical protein [Gemmatimonadota bacterium]